MGGNPPTVKLGDRSSELDYDKSTSLGLAASTQLVNWLKETTNVVRAPWRMTAGSGGSEFGSLLWYETLKSGFGATDDVPQFKLWQLALADHVVRHMPRHMVAINLRADTFAPKTGREANQAHQPQSGGRTGRRLWYPPRVQRPRGRRDQREALDEGSWRGVEEQEARRDARRTSSNAFHV